MLLPLPEEMPVQEEVVSDYLGFACKTCKKQTRNLGERMNRNWELAEVIVQKRLFVRDAIRAVEAIGRHFRIEASRFGGPPHDIELTQYRAWFEAHAEHEMEVCGEFGREGYQDE